MDVPETKAIDTLEAFDALVSPRRLQLIEFFRTPGTARDAAEHFDVPVTRLYYHINALLEHELLRVVSERKRGALVERQFQVTAQSFSPSQKFMDQYGSDGLLEVIRLTFADAESALRRAVESGLVSIEDRDSERVVLGYSSMQLTEDGLREMVRTINEIIRDTPDDPNGIRVGGLIALFPKAEN